MTLLFEGVDFAVRAVGEANGQRDPIEPGVDHLDKRHLISALFQHPRLPPFAEQLLQHFTWDDFFPEGTAAVGARRSFAVRDRRIAVPGRFKGVFECAPTIRNAQSAIQ